MTNLKIPEIGEFLRGTGTLVAIEKIVPDPPPEPPTDYIFEEITARTEVRRNGEVMKRLSTFNDFDGLNTSVEAAIEEAQEYATERSIGPGSELEVVVVRIAERGRMRPCLGENYYSKEYLKFTHLDRGCRFGMPEPVETVVWSSKNAD